MLAAALAAAGPAQAQAAAARVRTGDYIAVIVNQELVTAGEVDRRVERAIAEAPRGTKMPPEPELRKMAIDALIEERAMISNAREMGMRVENPELERAIQNIAAQNQITLPVLRDRLRAEGIDYTQFRNNVRDQLLTERVREREVQARIRVTDAEIDDYLDKRREAASAVAEYNIAQILVTVPDGASAAETARRRERAESAQKRVQAGEAFETVAREMSEDASAQAGGDLGWTSPGSFVPEFEDAMNRLPLGGISPPVASRFGLHLIQVLERRSATLDPKDVREQARARLRESKFEGTYLEWAKELRLRAYVELREPPT